MYISGNLMCVGLVFLAVRHVKLKALVTGLAVVTAAPVTDARGNQSPVTKQQLIFPDRSSAQILY